jgi:hypothetical protein
MTEQKPEKKVVSRTIAIALGIICIILIVGLLGVVANYTSIINDKDNTILSGGSQASNLQRQVNNLTAIINQQQSKIWVSNQPVSTSASTNTSWTFSASYAGSVVVTVIPAYGYSNVLAYIRVTYHYGGVHYDNQINNSTSPNVGDFPILPSSNIQIMVGTSNPKGLTGNVTITYFY